jgi:site-specific recombinase XerC
MANRKSRQYLSAAELGAALSHVRTRADLARQKGTTRAVVDELIVLLLARAGLRPQELCALRIGDLPGMHPAPASLDASRGGGGETVLWIRDTSGGVARKVNISEDLAERLARFVRFYRNGAQAADSLLESERGGPLSYMSLYSKVRRIGREAGIGELSPVTLRRTYVHQLYEAEQGLRYVQEQAGYLTRRSAAQAVKTCRPTGTAAGGGEKQPEQVSREATGMDPEQTPTCEACGAVIARGRGGRIESGQVLCDGCLRYFRRA